MLAICWFDLKHFSEIRLKLSQQLGQPLKTIQSILCKTARLIFYNAAFFLGRKQIQAVFRQSLHTIFGLNRVFLSFVQKIVWDRWDQRVMKTTSWKALVPQQHSVLYCKSAGVWTLQAIFILHVCSLKVGTAVPEILCYKHWYSQILGSTHYGEARNVSGG